MKYQRYSGVDHSSVQIIDINFRISIQKYMSRDTHTHIWRCTNTHTYSGTDTHIHKEIYTHTYIQSYTNTCAHTLGCSDVFVFLYFLQVCL